METLISKVAVPEGTSTIPVKLLGGRIFIKWMKPESKLGDKQLIDRPETMEEEWSKGEVMAVGPGTTVNKVDVLPGQIIAYYRQMSIKDFPVGEEKYDLVPAANAIAIL